MSAENLFHGSPTRKLTILKPGCETGKSLKNRVYATDDLAIASIFTLKNGPGDIIFDKDTKRIFLTINSKEFGRRNRGGSVYAVGEEGFEYYSEGLWDEWVAMDCSKIIISKEINITSALSKLSEKGYEIFTDFNLFCDIEECLLSKGDIYENLLRGHKPINKLHTIISRYIKSK